MCNVLDLLETHSATLEVAPPLNIVPGQVITEGQFGVLQYQCK